MYLCIRVFGKLLIIDMESLRFIINIISVLLLLSVFLTDKASIYWALAFLLSALSDIISLLKVRFGGYGKGNLKTRSLLILGAASVNLTIGLSILINNSANTSMIVVYICLCLASYLLRGDDDDFDKMVKDKKDGFVFWAGRWQKRSLASLQAS